MEKNEIIEEKVNLNWIEEEEQLRKEQMENSANNMERFPSLIFEEDNIVELEIDFSKKFNTWVDEKDDGRKIPKAIMPVLVRGEKLNWWISKFNPVYWDILNKAKKGQTKFKVLRTGQKLETRYTLLEE